MMARIDLVATIAERRKIGWEKKGYEAEYRLAEGGQRAVICINKDGRDFGVEIVESDYWTNPKNLYHEVIAKGLCLGVAVPRKNPNLAEVVRIALSSAAEEVQASRNRRIYVLTYDENGDVERYDPEHKR